MQFFEEVGDRVLASWKRACFDEGAFSQIACDAISRTPPAASITMHDVAEWVLTTRRLGRQNEPHQRFGDPSIRVYESERFYIEVLFWLDGTTAIHEHAFSGAFHVMSGASVHTEYEFQSSRNYNAYFATGRVTPRKVELLKAGDTRPIASGEALIHSLFHLDRPSISVVVRTSREPQARAQRAFYRAGFACDPFFRTVAMRKAADVLVLLARLGDPSFEERATEHLASADAHSAVAVALDLLPWSRHEQFCAMAARLDARAPEIAGLLRDAETAFRRERAIVEMRGRVHDPEHRFLLALLLNSTSRRDIFDIVRKAHPGAEPVDTIERWVRALASSASDGVGPLGVGLEEAELAVLARFLRSPREADVLRALCDEFGSDEVAANRDDVIALCASLRTSVVLAPLFQVTSDG